MYKILIFVILFASSAANSEQLLKNRLYNIYRLHSDADQIEPRLDLCPECINEAIGAIDTLLNIIVNEGILKSCGALCGALANKTSSPTLGIVCELACEAVGIEEFNRLLITLDIDPIYYCELATLCPINDHGDAKFTNFGVTPHTGHSHTEFVFDCSFTTINGTGTGMLRITIVSSTEDYLLEAKKPGTYTEKIGITALDFNYGPTKEGYNGWPLGTYNISAQICNGECGSKHPHSETYVIGNGTFVVTK